MLMPMIDLDAANLTAAERAIAEQILVTRGANKGRLLTSKPNKEEIYEHNNGYRVGRYRRNLKGEAAYVWRMVCFGLVAAYPHSCLPMMCDLEVGDLTMSQEDRRKRCKELDEIVRKIEGTKKVSERAGLMRWHQALHGGLPEGVKEELPNLTYSGV